MKIGMIGLSLSHPYAFADILRSKGVESAFVWDYEKERAEKYSADYGAQVVSDPREMIDRGADGVILCGIAKDRAQQVLPFLEAGIPTFITKPLVTNREDLGVLSETVQRTGAPIFSTSTLRYVPGVVAIREMIAAGSLGALLGATGSVVHQIGYYMTPPNTWQDNPLQGGGSIINMGIHAVEMLVAAMGTGIESVHCYAGKRHYQESQSEDVAAISLRYRDGKVGAVNVICSSKSSGYDLTVFGVEKSVHTTAPSGLVSQYPGAPIGGADHLREYGYTPTIEAFLRMIETKTPPIPFEETLEIHEALIAARESASGRREVAIR